MISFRDHHSYLVLGTLQACTVLGGGLLTGAFVKARELVLEDIHEYSNFTGHILTFTRFWGFTFLMIPAIWVCGSIWLERHHPEIATRGRLTTLGILIFAGLIILYHWLVSSALTLPYFHN